jgi:hypothetical protein
MTQAEDFLELKFLLRYQYLDQLAGAILRRTTRTDPLYQQWMSRIEIDAITGCSACREEVLSWLNAAGIPTEDISWLHNVVTVRMARWKWEALISPMQHPAAVPKALVEHVALVVGGSTLRKAKTALTLARQPPEDTVTVDLLRNYYKFPSNDLLPIIDHNYTLPVVTQTIFEAAEQYFSPRDLYLFQNSNELPHSLVRHPQGYNTSDCASHACVEGNLLTQYATGLAPGAATVYHYLEGEVPFAAWILEAATVAQPSPVQLISFVAVEQVQRSSALELLCRYSYVCTLQAMDTAVLNTFNTEALKLALMGVTIIVPAGDNGVTNFPDQCDTPSGSADQGHWAVRRYALLIVFPAELPRCGCYRGRVDGQAMATFPHSPPPLRTSPRWAPHKGRKVTTRRSPASPRRAA